MQIPVVDAMLAVALGIGTFVFCMLLIGYILYRTHRTLAISIDIDEIQVL